MNLLPGNIVRLRGGGPRLTVLGTFEWNNSAPTEIKDTVSVAWIDRMGIEHRSDFPIAAVERAEHWWEL